MVEQAVFYNLGQISEHHIAGSSIIQYLTEYKSKRVLEIGTWNGLGTTRCILKALSNYDFETFISLESSKIKHEVAVNNNRNFLNEKIKLLNATILEEQDFQDAKIMFKNDMNLSWLDQDYENFKDVPNIYNEVISKELDAIILDGGEYTTYQEYKKLLPFCKGLIFLDDTSYPASCKSYKIVEELQNNPEWECLLNSSERNGFVIFKHKNLTKSN
jgi:hypothetical protein